MTSINRIFDIRSTGRLGLTILAVVLLTIAGGTPTAHAQFEFTDINPDTSNLDPSDPDGASGGRVNGLSTEPGNNTTFYAASEWGGLYKTTDGGLTWFRLDAHNPNAAWDVEVNPGNASNVYATSFYDGRDGSSLAGINVSTNSGTSWNRPATALPPGGGFCSDPNASTHPSAFGIAVDPADTNDVYIGTNCGLAVSNDAGATWDYRNTVPGFRAWWVIDVVVHHGSIIDICGYWGHQRSTDGGLTFSEPSDDLPGGRCSIAASPDEADVLFVTVQADIFESDDGGATWTNLGTPDTDRQGRIPFVATNKRSGDSFDLWYGDIRLYRGECTSNVGGLRCPEAHEDPEDDPPDGWNGPFTRSVGGHDDVGDIVFDVTAADNACPEIFSSDGGVYYNTDTGDDCHNPDWEQPSITPHGLWLWTMNGVDISGDDETEHLYMGNQDNGSFGAVDGGATLPTWDNARCCDGFDTSADADQVLFTVCCGGGRATKLWHGNPGMTPYSEVNNYPDDGLFPGFRFPDIIDTFGPGDYVALTVDCTVPGDDDDDNGCSGDNDGDGGIHIATGTTLGSISWTEIGDASEPPTGGDDKVCAVKAALEGSTPTFYVQVGRCNGVANDDLWKFVGTDPNDSWTQVDTPSSGVTIFDVDPTDPDRLFAASNPGGGSPATFLSDDGGDTWDPVPELDTLMTGDGDFRSRVNINPWGNNGYPQPTLVAFDPEDPRILVAGGWDSGVFISTDFGEDWFPVTDPDSMVAVPPHLPQPRYAYFDHEATADGEISMYIGTRGRGVWRVSFDQPPIADANGPYNTMEGTDVQLDGTGSYDPSPGGSIVSYEWDFDDDGQFDDAVGSQPFFDPVGDGVGQDGIYTVRLRVTDNDGLTDEADSMVTVTNVAPTVAVLNSDSPRNENTVITVTATITDPGWLDVLTATIDWGVGAGAVPMTQTGSDNTRPDAEYTFSATYIYGDNGAFTAQVCGYDDDTSTCDTIGLTILNVDPTVAIDETDIDEGCGEDAFIAHAGEEVEFTGNATDPGSDDLDLTWSWGDGTPDVTTTYLVNPPATDPLPSPSIQPRDVDDSKSHAFEMACLYEVTFSALDDDGGTDTDTTDVVIQGNANLMRSAGYWHHSYKRKGRRFFTDEQLQCYLDIVNHMSSVFSEETNVLTLDDAEDVLNPAHSNGDIRVQFDRQLIAVWLNFSNGAIEHDEEVDTDFDDIPDTPLMDVLCAAEDARLNPATTDAELENWKDILEKINLMDAGSQSS